MRKERLIALMPTVYIVLRRNTLLCSDRAVTLLAQNLVSGNVFGSVFGYLKVLSNKDSLTKACLNYEGRNVEHLS